jgi:RNA polymerase sigma-70 factor (ECF subfamily)
VTQHDPSRAIPHELLLDQAGFLRRLARDLVHDAHSAEDAVQDVMVAALERPPRHDGNLHGWLGAVLRNLVSKRSRAHVRRVQHEQESARLAERSDELAPLESESTVRFVTDAVLALDEPLRSAILLRYFEDLPVREIAKRQRVPLSTVKSRLQRALEILRVRLKNTSGDSWRASLLALMVPGEMLRHAPLAGVGKGVILMSLKTKLAVASVALIASIVVYRRITSEPESTPDSNHAVAALTPALERTGGDSKPVAATETADPRSQVPPATSLPAAAVDPRPDSLLYGSLLDPEGKPISGAPFERIGITDRNGNPRYVDAKSDGAFAFHAMPFGKYWMFATVDGFVPSECAIELRPEQPHLQRDITLQRAPRLRVIATTPEGEDLALALEKAGPQFHHWKGSLVPIATEERPGTWWTEMDGNPNNPYGLGRYRDDDPVMRTDPAPAEKGFMGVLTLTREPPLFVSLLDYHRVLQTREVKRGDEEVRFVVSAEEIAALLATLQIRIVDAGTLEPVKGVSAEVNSKNGGQGTRPSDENGIIAVKGLDPGEYEVRVKAKDFAIASHSVLVQAGADSDPVQIALEPGVAFEARVVDGSGAPFDATFNMGVLEGLPGDLVFDRNMGFGTRGGLLQPWGLGRHLYVLHTDNLGYARASDDERTKWVSGNVLIDLRSGMGPANFELRLKPARRLVIVVKDDNAVGLRFQVLDEGGISVVGDPLFRAAPFGVSLPDGNYKVQLLDSSRKILCEKQVTLGSSGATVELSR